MSSELDIQLSYLKNYVNSDIQIRIITYSDIQITSIWYTKMSDNANVLSFYFSC